MTGHRLAVNTYSSYCMHVYWVHQSVAGWPYCLSEVSLVTDLRGRLGARVKQLRQARRLTQEQLAERAGLSYKFVGEVERGKGNPTLTTLGSLSEALGVALSDLLGVEAEKPMLSARQASLVRDALASIETLVERAAAPPDAPPRRRPPRR
jgi:transcriptional regulator with XRE-family HTH domain